MNKSPKKPQSGLRFKPHIGLHLPDFILGMMAGMRSRYTLMDYLVNFMNRSSEFKNGFQFAQPEMRFTFSNLFLNPGI
jgi:hypothetical protein